ncbi:RluA family pseudouridine synthase [Metabacillus arenae]|uniref:Pseudouridine synthase n=1 Tax=Metabacillus arenae TaxID=2771434 RepID=A0A926NSG7_9BACI|nr:RluA family pseudouridine synthase [Metabacillus arenae]MBD1383076.1 RluA family pseudouridine synthase [Metabacillus arenae]
MTKFKLEWVIVNEQAGMMVREFLKLKRISKRALTDIKYFGGDIKINGKSITVRYNLKKGDLLSVYFPTERPSASILPEELPLKIVYEDDHCLVINKDPFIPTIPSREHPSGTIANGLLAYFQKQNLASTIHVVTRLDKDTSGLLLVAKHRFAHSLFSTEQKQRNINRTYLAITEGIFPKISGTIDAPIGRKDTSIIEREVRREGQKAVTHYQVMRQFGDKSLLCLKLETGRTHQIRVHCAHLGHPLCGDTLYGGKRDEINRQALHSSELTFWHPILEKQLSFKAELPADMEALVNQTGE